MPSYTFSVRCTACKYGPNRPSFRCRVEEDKAAAATALPGLQAHPLSEEDEFDFETVPASWAGPHGPPGSLSAEVATAGGLTAGAEGFGTAQQAAHPSHPRLERFNSLARGNSSDGLRHAR